PSSDTLSFTVNPFVTAAPVVTPTVINPFTVMLGWLAVPGATSYQLRLDDLTSHVSYALWQTGLTGTSFQVNALTPLHSYRAWLDGVTALSSGPWNAADFSMLSPLSAPVITGPTGSVANPPTITWQTLAGASSYTLRIDDLTAGASYFVWQTGLTGT